LHVGPTHMPTPREGVLKKKWAVGGCGWVGLWLMPHAEGVPG